MESGTRLDELVRFGTPLTAPWVSRDDLVARSALGMHARPGARFRHWVINPQGTRGPTFDPDRPAEVLRIATAGASETFGLGESPGREFPRQLEDTLARALASGAWTPCGRSRIEVINPAAPGMTLPTVIQDLRLRVARWSPDVVVYYPTPTQYLGNRLPATAAPDSGVRPMRPGFRFRFLPRLADGIRELIPAGGRAWLREQERARLATTQGPGWGWAEVPEERLATFDRDLRHLVGTVHTMGARAVLMVHAHRFDDAPMPDDPWLGEWRRYAPRATSGVLLAFEEVARLATLRVAADSGIPAVDLPAAIGGDTASFADFSHFTDLGAARVAGALGRAVRATVPSCSAEPRG